MTYEYNKETNEIYPVYINLSSMTNKNIIAFFIEGLSTKNLVDLFLQRYGNNEYRINIRIYLFSFFRNDIPSFTIVLVVGIIEYSAFPDKLALLIKISAV